MGAREVETSGLGNTSANPKLLRRLAVHCADRVARQHPGLPGRRIAHDPTSRADVRELLHAIGFLPEPQGAHVSTTTDLKPADIANVIDKAADIIDRNGHHKGYLYDEAKADDGLLLNICPVDAVGAINIAVFGMPRWPAEDHPDSPLAQAAILALEGTVSRPVPGWNDEDERTQDDVITVLWETSERLRKEAS